MLVCKIKLQLNFQLCVVSSFLFCSKLSVIDIVGILGLLDLVSITHIILYIVNTYEVEKVCSLDRLVGGYQTFPPQMIELV